MTVKLTINGHEVEVENGTTILDAARKLGIEVPTLCHADGLEPATSCFLCVVQVEGNGKLVPACAAPAEDDIVVATDSKEVREARRVALELLLSDHAGDCEAPCRVACPADVDIPEFLRHIVEGDDSQALTVIKEHIALPRVLGRICPRYCERACRRAQFDEAVAICALKRFAADAARDAPPLPPQNQTEKRVAIVGAGPAGLSAAYHLMLRGHVCTIFDDHPMPGGMLRYGISNFRLPQAALDADIEGIRRLGAEFRMNTRFGQDVALDQLRSEYHAIFIAIGAQKQAEPRCDGAGQAVAALAFLRQVNEGHAPDMGKAVLVLGGSDEALDAARTALRLGAQQVTILCAEQGPKTLSDCVESAQEEGVRIEGGLTVSAIEPSGEGQYRVVCRRDDDEVSFDASFVIAAGERCVDLALAESQGLAVSARGIAAARTTLATQIEGVFAGGEAFSGPAAAVRAVAAGRRAAISIDQYLAGQRVVGEPRSINVHIGKLSPEELAIVTEGVRRIPRVQSSIVAPESRRMTFDEVDRGLSEADARAEAARCLQCDCLGKRECKLRRYATEYGAKPGQYKGERRPFARDASHPDVVYESGKCILCGLCVRIAEQAGEKLGMSFLQRGFAARTAVPFGRTLAQGLSREVAKRCAAACPTGALALKHCAL